MGDRIIMSSTTKDSHGDIMTKEALEHAVTQINGEQKLPYNMNHRRELPPLGRTIDARLEESGNVTLLIAENILFPHRKKIDWDDNLIMEYFDDPAPFISRYDQSVDKPYISLDPSNFEDPHTFDFINREIYSIDNGVKLKMHGRKAEIPIPEIIIGVAKWGVLYKLLKPFAEKFTEKIAEKLAEDTYEEAKKQLKKFRDYVVRVVKLTRKQAIPKNKTLAIVFEIHSSPFIELIAKTDDPELISKGLSEKKLAEVQIELAKFSQHFSIITIQFKLNDKGSWKFNYLLTDEGAVIGHKASFEERDKQYKRYRLQSLPGHTLKYLRR